MRFRGSQALGCAVLLWAVTRCSDSARSAGALAAGAFSDRALKSEARSAGALGAGALSIWDVSGAARSAGAWLLEGQAISALRPPDPCRSGWLDAAEVPRFQRREARSSGKVRGGRVRVGSRQGGVRDDGEAAQVELHMHVDSG